MSGKPNSVKTESPKPYEKPTLTRGVVLSAVTAAAPTVSGIPSDSCWIARAAFGETDIRWMIFRVWLLDDAPWWFRSFYMRYGPAIGAWLAHHEGARHLVRALMIPAIKRKLAM
jgi:hypothetical protein